ncbi:hypothetical protein [Lysinibacillus sp. LZ02]|uniref:hypothetical protein n=1 Tax=Lysinibacillus sp. LZ02 TaxID=3420668 RepID=UPI003D36367A
MEGNTNTVIENGELYNYSKIQNRHESGFDFATLSDNELEIILTTIINEIQYTANGSGAFWGTMGIIIAMFLGMTTLPNVSEKLVISVAIVYLILVSGYFFYSTVRSAKRQKLLHYFRRVKDNK